MKRGVAIEDYLKPLAPEQTQCYLTDTLQVADIVEWALAQIGRSTIWQTSFSISEEFIRRLYFISKSGIIQMMCLILLVINLGMADTTLPAVKGKTCFLFVEPFRRL